MTGRWKLVLVISLIFNVFVIYVGYKALDYRRHINHFLYKYIHVSAEFSQRAVYGVENKQLTTGANSGERVVFFGTQVIKNWDLPRYFPECEPVNRGVPGQRAGGFLLRFRPDVLDLEPRGVVIEISSYNLRPGHTIDELMDYAACMAELAEYHNIVPILTTMIPPTRDITVEDFEELGDYQVVDSVQLYNSRIRSYCDQTGVLLVDFDSLLSNERGYFRADLSSSTIEPNEAGYAVLSEAVLAVLKLLE